MKYCLITKQHTDTGCQHQYCNAPEVEFEGKKYKKVEHDLVFETKAIDENAYTVEGVFSSAIEDLQGEVVDQNGWDLTQFLKNPVVLFSHEDHKPAIGQVVAIGIDDNGNLAGKIKFAVKEYDFAATIFKLYAGRYMRAFSAGFLNNDYEVDTENQRIILKTNKLLEMSCVTIPANELALAKSKGIDIEPINRRVTQHAKEVLEIATKEGRVLSAKNRGAVEAAINALQEVLKADTKSADSAPQQKVVTPASTGSNIVKLYKGRESINKALRALIKNHAK